MNLSKYFNGYLIATSSHTSSTLVRLWSSHRQGCLKIDHHFLTLVQFLAFIYGNSLSIILHAVRYSAEGGQYYRNRTIHGMTWRSTSITFDCLIVYLKDEPFHIPQAQAYCRGEFSSWDPKITTPPGL